MKNQASSSSSFQQRISLVVALLFCLFVSSIEYLPTEAEYPQSEQSSEQSGQSFLTVAVDAVVPFVVQVADTVFYLISFIFDIPFDLPLPEAVSPTFVNSLAEILFERIISTKGP